MPLKDFLEASKGAIKEVTIGKEGKSATIGGEAVLPFHNFEGNLPRLPVMALEVWDTTPPETWPDHLRSHFGDVVNSPVLWAKKCLEVYKADLICLYLASAAEGEPDAPALAAKVKEIGDALPAPMIVYGTGEKDVDTLVLREVARACAGDGLLLGPVLKENHKEIAEAAQEYGHALIAQTPIDINLAKELNIKLSKFFPKERIVIDPLSSALGYGMDYSFSVMERIKQVAVLFGDDMMKMPIIANLGRECWRAREAKENDQQGILWEAITAMTMFLAGANLAVVGSPDSMKLVKKLLGQFSTGQIEV